MSEGEVLDYNIQNKEEKVDPKVELERQRQMKEAKKQMAIQIVAYKKDLRDTNEIKKLQVEELDLNIAYYKARSLWRELKPKMEELEAIETAELQELRKKQYEEAEKAKKEKAKPIVVQKQGTPRKDAKK